jgi:putative glutamine amidotransferase
MTMKAGVSLRVVENPIYKERHDQISHDLITFLQRQGMLPVLMPNLYEDITAYADSMGIDFLLLSGGNNVVPINQDESLLVPDAFIERDLTEKKLIHYALENQIPILGICRGMQMINVYFHGKIERDLKSVCQGETVHVCERHEIRIIHEEIKSIMGTSRIHTNSYHNQGILANDLGIGLKPFALGEGNNIEGFYHPTHHMIGVQWHPERKYSHMVLDQLLLEAWMDLEKYKKLFLS